MAENTGSEAGIFTRIKGLFSQSRVPQEIQFEKDRQRFAQQHEITVLFDMAKKYLEASLIATDAQLSEIVHENIINNLQALEGIRVKLTNNAKLSNAEHNLIANLGQKLIRQEQHRLLSSKSAEQDTKLLSTLKNAIQFFLPPEEYSRLFPPEKTTQQGRIIKLNKRQTQAPLRPHGA